MEERHVTLGRHSLIWVSYDELRSHFDLVSTNDAGVPSLVGIPDEVWEGIIVAPKAADQFLELERDARFEVFLVKPSDRHGPAMAALECMDLCVPDLFEE